RHMQYMVWPRSMAVAECLWSPKEKKDWNSFVKRVEASFGRMDVEQVKYARSMFDAIITPKKDLAANDSIIVDLATEIQGLDFYNNTSTGKLWVHNKYGPKEEMPVDIYFRDMDSMPELEWVALHQCRGSILDIGAGAGSHALALQKMKLDITALDISPLSAAV